MASQNIIPVDMESRLVGDMAVFRASDVELLEAFDPGRPCLGRARERLTGDLILVQVSGKLQGGFAWAYAQPHATLPPHGQAVSGVVGQPGRMASPLPRGEGRGEGL